MKGMLFHTTHLPSSISYSKSQGCCCWGYHGWVHFNCTPNLNLTFMRRSGRLNPESYQVIYLEQIYNAS